MGYRFIGGAAGDRAGASVVTVGDIDGDGAPDLLIGANGSDIGGTDAGSAYLIPAADLAALDAADGASDGIIDLGLVGLHGGYVLTGVAAADGAGISLAAAGDVDGDGLADFLIGAPTADPGGTDAGASYLVLAAGLASLDTADGTVDGIIDLGQVGPAGGYRLTGSGSEQAGGSLAIVGDVDGDGVADLLIGASASGSSPFMAGAAYLVSAADVAALDAADGSVDGNVDLDEVAGLGGYRFLGTATFDLAGRSVGSAGDIDGDGRADLLISAIGANGAATDAGLTYLIPAADLAALDAADGASDGTIRLANVGPAGGYRFLGAGTSDFSGVSVRAVGDVDGDGTGDLLIAAPLANTQVADPGASYLVMGSDLAALDAADGTTDGAIRLGNVGAHGGYRFVGAAAQDYSGGSVAAVGDVDGDGLADLLIGATGADSGGPDAGAAYLIPAGDLATLDAADGVTDGIIGLANVGTHGGYVLNGAAAGDSAGRSVASAGDIDGDGLGDLLIGADLADGGGADSGEAYLLLAKHLAAADTADGSADGIIDLANAPICFVRGTRIATIRGPVPVEDLAPGDRVLTMDMGYRPLVWVGRTARLAYGKMAPVRIAAGTLGNARDLLVSPQHRMLLRGAEARAFGAPGAAFVPAIRLANGTTIRQVEGGTVEYFHVMCDRHQVLFAEGAASESFFPGPQAWKTLPAEARAELLDLFPDLAPEAAERAPGRPGTGAVPGYGPLARTVAGRSPTAGQSRRAAGAGPRRRATPAEIDLRAELQ